MTTIFELRKDNSYLSSNVVGGSEDYIYDNFDKGKLVHEISSNIKLQLAINGAKDLREADDFPFISTTIPVFSERFVTEFRSELLECGQLISAKCDSSSVYIFNTVAIEDLVDVESSSFRYCGGIFLGIDKIVLKDECPALPFFKLKSDLLGPTYLRQDIKQRIEKKGFRGLQLKAV